MAGRHRLAVSLMAISASGRWPGPGGYVAPVELVERASLQAPRIPVSPLFTPLSAVTR